MGASDPLKEIADSMPLPLSIIAAERDFLYGRGAERRQRESRRQTAAENHRVLEPERFYLEVRDSE